MSTEEELCLACGMCCDGTLFDNVRLEPDEAAEELKALGLPVRRSRAKQPVDFVGQPCAALCRDRSCRIYAQRPRQCRSFECGLFKRLGAGQIDLEAALRTVKGARGKAEAARRLMRRLGESDEALSLNKRFRRVKRRLEAEGADATEAELFGKLGLAMHQLDLLAHRSFYSLERPE